MRRAGAIGTVVAGLGLAIAWGCAETAAVEQTPQELAHDEFSLSKTGTVHTPSDPDERSTAIPHPADAGPPRAIADTPPAAAPVAATPVTPVRNKVPDEVLALDRNMQARIDDVLACRRKVAADRHVAVARVPADGVRLRWTIEPGGAVSNAEAVAVGSTDPDVLSCARRTAESWLFVRAPDGAPLRIDQPLRFD